MLQLTSYNKVGRSWGIVHNCLSGACVSASMFQLGISDEQLSIGIQLWTKTAVIQISAFFTNYMAIRIEGVQLSPKKSEHHEKASVVDMLTICLPVLRLLKL